MAAFSETSVRYIPGVCNIGPAEIVLRKRVGWLFAATTVILAVAFHSAHVRPELALTLFFPATISSLGFFQAYLHFCVKFGMQGLFNVSATELRTETIDQAEWRKKDKQKAITIILGSLVVSVAISSLLYLLLS